MKVFRSEYSNAWFLVSTVKNISPRFIEALHDANEFCRRQKDQICIESRVLFINVCYLPTNENFDDQFNILKMVLPAPHWKRSDQCGAFAGHSFLIPLVICIYGIWKTHRASILRHYICILNALSADFRMYLCAHPHQHTVRSRAGIDEVALLHSESESNVKDLDVYSHDTTYW